jgi:CheY-like chemotaxis protein
MPPGKGCILFVDDEVALAHMGCAILEHLGYDVVVGTGSRQALDTFRAMPQRFDLVITDQTMPHMTGEVLAQELRCLRPDIPIILCTGYSPRIDAEKAKALGIDAFLMKPWQAHDLARIVRDVMAP